MICEPKIIELAIHYPNHREIGKGRFWERYDHFSAIANLGLAIYEILDLSKHHKF